MKKTCGHGRSRPHAQKGGSTQVEIRQSWNTAGQLPKEMSSGKGDNNGRERETLMSYSRDDFPEKVLNKFTFVCDG